MDNQPAGGTLLASTGLIATALLWGAMIPMTYVLATKYLDPFFVAAIRYLIPAPLLFVLALAYRSYQLTTIEEVSNDPEDTRVAERADEDGVDRDIPDVVPARDTDAPDELDALPGAEGSR